MDGKTREAIKIAKRYIEVLKENGIRVTRAYLYGSYATGEARADSDIDIVVVSSQFKGVRFEDSYRIARYCRNVDLRISPLAYHPRDFKKDYIIPYEAMTKGIRIV
ncbi:MAG: nucleotidyltransferase domain-containing protein [Bacteroidetes bacterium]|nr:nucleotidyltransferase domain-containing protein [Bacteroidota bacterium]